ncbi:unnamed protein product [Adineta steineri]|uniref:Uncharacterized protein n=3 Tax=Adineta steineri TaxID=433720 RepID=A0A818PTW8_9BILA|nr:unnamed protein product [Adineta steineri]
MTNTVLDSLLKTDFEQNQVLWDNLQFHSHNAHHLGALASLGASDQQLKDIYTNTMRKYAEKYEPSPHEITDGNWRNSLSDRRFCMAYRDFFNKKLPTQGNWKGEFFKLLLDDKDGLPLINASLSGLLHPIIHISYAIDLNSRPVACEALTMTAVCVGSIYKLPAKLEPPANGIKGALRVMKEIRSEDYAPTLDEPAQFDSVLKNESLLLAYYNEWQMPANIEKAVEELFDMSVYIYGATHKPDQIDFDFGLLHLLTGMNAIRTLQPYLDEKTVKRLLCCFFYLSLVMYISQRQPKINEHLINDYQIEEGKRNWEYVVDRTLHTKLATEVHCVKVIRTLKDAEAKYGSKDGFYLKTAIKSVDNINVDKPWNYYKSHEPWIGMSDADRELNIKH